MLAKRSLALSLYFYRAILNKDILLPAQNPFQPSLGRESFLEPLQSK